MILDYAGGPRYSLSKRRGMRWGGGVQREIGDVAWKWRSERKGETWTCHYSFDKKEGGVTNPGTWAQILLWNPQKSGPVIP